jgi:hypothetical protein
VNGIPVSDHAETKQKALENGAEWSEAVAEKETVCIWRCMGCGNEFETTDKAVVQGPSIFELVEEFLPNLVVA